MSACNSLEKIGLNGFLLDPTTACINDLGTVPLLRKALVIPTVEEPNALMNKEIGIK